MMKISRTGDQTSVSPAEGYPVVLWKARLFQWMHTPGSFFQAVAAVGAVIVLGQLVFGSITLTAAIAEFSTLVFLGLTLPPSFRSIFGRKGATTEADGDGGEPHNSQ